MVGDEDVRVAVTTGSIVMHDDHVVGRVHALNEFHRCILDAFHISATCHVELVGVEREHIRIELHGTSMDGGESFGAVDECR